MADLDLGACVRGNHPFERLAVVEMVGARGDAAIRWCPQCGAVVVDIERRGRMVKPGGVVRERIPAITQAMLGLVKNQG